MVGRYGGNTGVREKEEEGVQNKLLSKIGLARRGQ